MALRKSQKERREKSAEPMAGSPSLRRAKSMLFLAGGSIPLAAGGIIIFLSLREMSQVGLLLGLLPFFLGISAMLHGRDVLKGGTRFVGGRDGAPARERRTVGQHEKAKPATVGQVRTISIGVHDPSAGGKYITQFFVVEEIVFLAWHGFRDRTINMGLFAGFIGTIPTSLLAGLRLKHPWAFLAVGGILFVAIVALLTRQIGAIGTTGGKSFGMQYSYRSFCPIVEEYLAKFRRKRGFVEINELSLLKQTRHVIRTDKIASANLTKEVNAGTVLLIGYTGAIALAMLAAVFGSPVISLKVGICSLVVLVPSAYFVALSACRYRPPSTEETSLVWQILQDLLVTQGATLVFIGGAESFFTMRADEAEALARRL